MKKYIKEDGQYFYSLRTLSYAQFKNSSQKYTSIVFMDKYFKLKNINVSKVKTVTPNYASLIIWKDNPYDYKTNIQSLDCVLYEICALKSPLRAEDLQGYKRIRQKLPQNFQLVIIKQFDSLKRRFQDYIYKKYYISKKQDESDIYYKYSQKITFFNNQMPLPNINQVKVISFKLSQLIQTVLKN